jgi:uncharacterized membrane protein HdeD (DUF308 family)
VKEEERTMFQPIGLAWGIVTLLFGILVLIYPRFLRYTVGIYLVIVGLWAIIPRLHFQPVAFPLAGRLALRRVVRFGRRSG